VEWNDAIRQPLDSLVDRYPVLAGERGAIGEVFSCLQESLANGGKLLMCGNGGSAADCDHWSGELLKGFAHTRPLSAESRARLSPHLAATLQGGLPAIPLPNLTALMTAFANDADPRLAFAQLVWALGREGDVLIAISTSGQAMNVAHAVEAARVKGMKTVGLTGRTGGQLKALVDVAICVPADETYRIQELHLPVYHALCMMLEAAFFPLTASSGERPAAGTDV
jgi:D-sedoheptulose 7-phosphate isomerase